MTDPEYPTPRPPRLRPRWLYRLSYVWAGLGVGWLLVSGRLIAYFAAFRRPLQQPPDPTPLFGTGLLWLLFIGPLLVLAYDLGVQHTEARRLNTSTWRGLRESWRVAWQQPRLDEMAAEFAERPEDDVSTAVLQESLLRCCHWPSFLGAQPTLRTWPGASGSGHRQGHRRRLFKSAPVV
jgi:hypothetical protein